MWNTGRYMTLMMHDEKPISSISSGSKAAMTRASGRRVPPRRSARLGEHRVKPPEASPPRSCAPPWRHERGRAHACGAEPSVPAWSRVRAVEVQLIGERACPCAHASTSGVPPASKVESERASCAAATTLASSPTYGIVANAVQPAPPASVESQVRQPRPARAAMPTSAVRRHRGDRRSRSSTRVGKGSAGQGRHTSQRARHHEENSTAG